MCFSAALNTGEGVSSKHLRLVPLSFCLQDPVEIMQHLIGHTMEWEELIEILEGASRIVLEPFVTSVVVVQRMENVDPMITLLCNKSCGRAHAIESLQVGLFGSIKNVAKSVDPDLRMRMFFAAGLHVH